MPVLSPIPLKGFGYEYILFPFPSLFPDASVFTPSTYTSTVEDSPPFPIAFEFSLAVAITVPPVMFTLPPVPSSFVPIAATPPPVAVAITVPPVILIVPQELL